jgi:glycine oxidase
VTVNGTHEANGGDGAVALPARSGGELDAVIVGAGVIGLACAWRAAQRGLRVRVLERDRPGAGASGVAAGMLAPVGEASWGEEAILALGLESAAAWPAFAATLADESGLETGYRRCGSVHVALDGDEAAELRRRHELMRSLGLEAEWLAPSAARELEPGLAPSCAGAIAAPDEATVDPESLLAALVAAVEAGGGEVRPAAEVVQPVLEGRSLRGVVTADGQEHRARAVVVATGCWSGALGWLPAKARPAVRPVKGQVLTLQGAPGAPVCDRLVVGERVYLVPREDGRLVVGATVEDVGFDLRVTAGGVHELLREAYRILPDVAELDFVEARAGMRPATPDNAPVIGPGELDGLFLATGHYRNGVLQAPITAEAAAAWMAGDPLPDSVAAFAPAGPGAEEPVG